MDNPIRLSAEFLTSASSLADCPQDSVPEVAFIGRSNSGKSSCLNRVTGTKSLARVSKTPGRTQLINFFRTPVNGRLVDLPGYGYAKVSKQKQAEWGHTVDRYLKERSNLVGLVLIIDSRHLPQPLDQKMLAWCRTQQTPLLVLLNKVDKATQRERTRCSRAVQELLEDYKLADVIMFSAKSGTGTSAVLQQLHAWFDSVSTQ